MDMNDTAVTQNSISERLSEIIDELSHNQMRFVIAMLDGGRRMSKKDAAEIVGIQPDTVYRWNGIVDEAIELFRQDAMITAQTIRKQNLVKAMAVKVAGLNSDDEALRQKTATEIIEWELGKAVITQDLLSGGQPMELEVVYINHRESNPTESS